LPRGNPDDEVFVAWRCCRRVRAVRAEDKPTDGKAIAEHIVATFACCGRVAVDGVVAG